jgi:transcriptional regulator with XRE-family HTH domain
MGAARAMTLHMRAMGRRPQRLADIEGPHSYGFLSVWREKANLTQAQVASHFDVSDVTIHRWETGKAPVTVRDFVLLARLYHADQPGHLLFPPTLAAEASTLREINDMIAGMSVEDRRRWVDLGRSLSTKHRTAREISTAA